MHTKQYYSTLKKKCPAYVTTWINLEDIILRNQSVTKGQILFQLYKKVKHIDSKIMVAKVWTEGEIGSCYSTSKIFQLYIR